MITCPKCGADISDTLEEDDPDVGIVGGYYCEACDLGVEAETPDFSDMDLP